jgi:hypothetical protein
MTDAQKQDFVKSCPTKVYKYNDNTHSVEVILPPCSPLPLISTENPKKPRKKPDSKSRTLNHISPFPVLLYFFLLSHLSQPFPTFHCLSSLPSLSLSPLSPSLFYYYYHLKTIV